MRARTILVVAGAVVAAKAAAHHRMRNDHAHHGSPSPRAHAHGHHHCGPGSPRSRLDDAEWKGLTGEEARTKLADELGDEDAIADALAYLDDRGYLAREAEPVDG